MSNPLRTVRGRLTIATALVVGFVTIVASLSLYTVARRSLVGDVRDTLTENLTEARDILNRGVTTELNLLALGVATDPLEQSGLIIEQRCAGVLADAYGDERQTFEDFYLLVGVDDTTYLRYDDCLFETDPFYEATSVCAGLAIEEIGNPTVTFSEFQEMYASGAFDAAYSACVQDSLLVDTAVDAAAFACDAIIFDAFGNVDVLDADAVAAETDTVLIAYADCMRANGVPDYPDISASTGDDVSVLNAVTGSGVLLPSLDSVRASVERFGIGMIVGVPILIALLGLLAWFVIGRTLAPVEAIRSQVAAITAKDLDRRVPHPGTDDEVARLASTMNDMLERLERSSERQRQFVSDASHELRSPLASIRAQLEVALAHPDHASWDEVSAGVLSEGSRMERLVDDLLALARADEGVLTATTDEVDLSDIAWDEARRIAELTVDISGVTDARIAGDPHALRRVIRNLLENAARHATTHVAISVRQDGDGGAQLLVDDDGTGIAMADRDRVFERFSRLEAARARDAGGVGLGLAVVRGIVRAHGGSIAIADSDLGGARFVVDLPARPTGSVKP